MRVKVLRNFDGLNGELVEVIERKPRIVGGRRSGIRSRASRYGPRRRQQVTYKGKRYLVFRLPANYGPLAGSCINTERT